MDDFLSALKTAMASKDATAVMLIIVSALLGSSTPYVKGERPFKIGMWFLEVLTSGLAGYFVYLVLRDSGIADGTINAISGIAGFYGTKLMPLFFRALASKMREKEEK